MYHSYISRKSKSVKDHYDFRQHKDKLLDIVEKMIEPNAEHTYPEYHIYKDLFSEFTGQLVVLDKQLNEKHIVMDISNDFIEEYKEVLVKEKTILDLFKNKNLIYEKDV